jgi:hypothetical protein
LIITPQNSQIKKAKHILRKTFNITNRFCKFAL